MNISEALNKRGLRFSWTEFSGSLGDLGLFIPLVVAMTISTDLDIGVVLIFAGVMNILTGWLFRQPIPVQPMKALAAVVIAESMLKEELVAAGILMGAILIVVAMFINHIDRLIPKSVVRGIQLGVGFKLAAIGAQWISELGLTGWNSMLSTVLIVCVLLLLLTVRQPALLYIFLFGFLLLYFEKPEVYALTSFSFPEIAFHWPSVWAWKWGFVKGVLPQLPLTVLNSVIAVCALSADYFPGKGISPRKMAFSVGLMNLVCVPFGGIPMCHGSGGLAAQHRFGARTGGSVIMLGVLKVVVGLVFGSALFTLLQSYPVAVLGPLLILAGVELASSVKVIFNDHRAMTIAFFTAAVILGAGTFVGFLTGLGIHYAFLIYDVIERTKSGNKET